MVMCGVYIRSWPTLDIQHAHTHAHTRALQLKEGEDDPASNDELSDGAGGKAGAEILESRRAYVKVCARAYICRVGQSHIQHIHCILAGKLPDIRSFTVCMHIRSWPTLSNCVCLIGVRRFGVLV